MNYVICIVLALASLAPAPEIVGKVVDDNGRAVPGVTISVVSPLVMDSVHIIRKTVSDSNGDFSFTDLGPGFYGVEAASDSACAVSDAFGLSTGATRVVRLRLITGLCQSSLHFAQPPAKPVAHRSGRLDGVAPIFAAATFDAVHDKLDS